MTTVEEMNLVTVYLNEDDVEVLLKDVRERRAALLKEARTCTTIITQILNATHFDRELIYVTPYSKTPSLLQDVQSILRGNASGLNINEISLQLKRKYGYIGNNWVITRKIRALINKNTEIFERANGSQNYRIKTLTA